MANEVLKNLIRAGKRVEMFEKKGLILSEEDLEKMSWEKQFKRRRK